MRKVSFAFVTTLLIIVVSALLTGCLEQNRAPQIKSITVEPTTTIYAGQEATITVVAEDPDGDSLTYQWQHTGTATLTSNGNIAKFTAQAFGEYIVTVTVSDGKGGTITNRVTINVVDPDNQDPTITSLATDKQEAVLGEDVNLVVVAEDQDGDNLTYNWETNDGIITQKENEPNKATFLPGKVGNNVVKVIVTDGRGGRAEKTITIVGTEKPKVVYIDTRTESQYTQSNLTKIRDYFVNKGYTVNFVTECTTTSAEFIFIQNGATYTTNELKLIKDFVYRGGKLIISSMSDYQDKGNTESMNAILKELNAPVEFNDDQVEDSQNKVTGVYDIKAPWNDGDIKFYSTCSIIVNDPQKAKILVKSYETANSVDKDGKEDKKPVTPPIPLVVEFTYGLGTVKALGTAGVYSNFDFDKTGFKNEEFIKTVLVGLGN